MSGIGAVPGFIGQVWNAYLASMTYFSANLDTSNPVNSLPLIQGVMQTCRNALNAIGANQYYNNGQPSYDNLSEVLTYPLIVDATTLAFVTNRLNAFQAAMQAFKPYTLSTVVGNVSGLSLGNPSVEDINLIDFWMAFNFETPPTGLTSANFSDQAQAAATAWQTVADNIVSSGISYNGTTYDSILQMGNSSQVTADEIANMYASGASVSGANLTQSWNLLVALPSLSRYVSILINDASNLFSQQTLIIRLVMMKTMMQLNSLLMSLKAQLSSKILLATVPNGQTLMDIAARKLGNFEDWQNIAAINDLQPPYIGNGPNLASPGSKIFLQSPDTQAATQAPSYEKNYLGVDIYLGPMDSPMLPWMGDFNIISGYGNLQFSLARRLMTTIGSLMYNPTFGSRIPPEIGKIQSQATAGHIAAFASSAILSDPRVYQVNSQTITLNANSTISYTGDVVPNGYGSQSVNLNEVLQPI